LTCLYVSQHQDTSQLSKPLIESMIYPKATTGFSVGNYMSLYCYEVSQTIEHESMITGALETPATLSFPFPAATEESPVEHNVINAMGELHKLRSRTLTLKTFEKLLEIFGLSRNQKFVDNPVVEVTEIAEFFLLICKYNIGTKEGLGDFIKAFRLDRFFILNDMLIQDQIWLLSAVIRALVPFRVSAYDGRHRFNLCCYFASGHFKPNNSLKLNKFPFEKIPGLKRGTKFHKCELFCPQTFNVAINTPESTIQVAYDVMIELGIGTTTSQDLAVKTDWRGTICEFLTFLQDRPDASEILRGLTFQNFWSRQDWSLPYKDMIEPLLQFVESSRESRKNLIIDGVRVDWEDIKKAVIKTKESKTYLLGYKEKPKPPKHLAIKFGTFLCLLKFLVVNDKNLTELRKYFQLEDWPVKQGRKMYPDDMPIFHSLEFMQSIVLFPTLVVSEICIQRCIVEKYLLEECRRADKDKDLEDDLKKNFPRFQSFIKKLALPLPKGEIATDEKLNTKKTSKVTTKMNLAIHVTLLSDVVETINRFGFNGRIVPRSDKNVQLCFYL
jgi:hypothetical protein